MKIKCIETTGKILSKKYFDNVRGESAYTDYQLTIDKISVVYAITIYRTTINYLLIHNDFPPYWYPAELFSIIDPVLPIEWYFNYLGYKNNVLAVWGYKELILDENHYDNLLEREKKDLEIFYKRKAEMDEYANLKCCHK